MVALIEPQGRSRLVHVNRSGGQTPGDIVTRNVDPRSELHTDESRAYREAGKQFKAHKTVTHGGAGKGTGIYVAKDGTTTNAAENFFGNFKRSMKGTYRFCGEQHLQKYLNEFQFRHNHRAKLGFTDGERTAAALKGIAGKRLTYR